MDDFEALASATYRKVGIDADGEDLVLFHLVLKQALRGGRAVDGASVSVLGAGQASGRSVG